MKRNLLILFSLAMYWVSAQDYLMQNGSATTCSGTFYDSGGATPTSGNITPTYYGHNEHFVYTFCPDTSSGLPGLLFNFVELRIATGDALYIYDGADVSAPLIGSYVGVLVDPANPALPPIQIGSTDTNPSGCITFEFISDGSVAMTGWEAEISCVVPCQSIQANIATVPTPGISGNVEVYEDDVIAFTGSGTFSQSGTGATYSWDFGDGSTGTGQNISHAYTSDGTYTVTLTITDSNNCSDTVTILVVVSQNLNTGCPEVAAVDGINLQGDLEVTCDYPLNNGCITLNAEFADIGAPTTYNVSSIPFDPPFDFTDGGQLGTDITSDDEWSSIEDLGFDFCFFNQLYDQVVVGDNGVVSFRTSYSGDDCPWDIQGSNYDLLPQTNWPSSGSGWSYTTALNAIYAFVDLHKLSSNPTTDGMLTFGVVGNYPCRTFVANFYNIPMYGCRSSKVTEQIVLYESTNIIDVYVQSKPYCYWNGNGTVIGIQNNTGTQAFWPTTPNRNTGGYTIVNEAYRFTPAGPSVVQINWYDENDVQIASNVSSIEVCPTADTEYRVEAIYSLCGGNTVIVEDEMTITFNNTPPSPVDEEIILCDIGLDGTESWNLTLIEASVLNGEANVYIENYYTNYSDADTPNTANAIADPSAYISSPGTIFVRVENNYGCHAVAEVTLSFYTGFVLDDTITDGACDNDNDGIEVFDLTTYETALLNGSTGDIYFYEVEADADAGNGNYITDEANYSTGTVTLYVRGESTNGCVDQTTITLTVSSPPTPYTFSSANDFCDNLADGVEVIDLTQFEATIVGSQTDINVFTYYNTNAEAVADDTTVAIADPTQYSLSTASTSVFLRLTNVGGCFTIVEIPLTLTDALDVSATTIAICDVGNDNTEDWDLTEAETNITTSTGLTFTYYSTQTGAETADTTALIPDPTNFASGETSIWVRVENTTGCYEVVEVTLSFDAAPDAVDTTLQLCDDDGDGTENFDLTLAESTVLNGQTGMTVSYYDNATDADAGNTNTIADPTSFAATSGTLVYVRVETTDGCSAVAEVTLSFYTQPIANAISNIAVCDDDDSGSESIDLTQYETTLLGGQTGMTVTYHTTQADAISGDNAITATTAYDVAVGTTTIYVRVLSADGCYAYTQFDVVISAGVTLANDTQYLCDDDQDGTEVWDLTSSETTIGNGETNISSFYYYTNLTDAQSNNTANAITTPSAYSSAPTTIYVTVVTDAGCINYAELILEFFAQPTATDAALQLCDDDGDGSENFDLTLAESTVLGGQTGMTVSYYDNATDADAGNTNTIADATSFAATSGTIVYVRVESTDGCGTIAEVTLSFYAQPTASMPADMVACDLDDDVTGDFDLTDDESTTLGGQTGMTVTYHTSLTDAESGDNAIASPSAYNVNIGSYTIYVRVESADGCYATTQFEITLNNSLPIVDASLELCDVDETGIRTFDLTEAEVQIANGATNYTYEYYETYADAESQSNIITTPTAFDSGTTIIYVRAQDPTLCASIAELQLTVNELPAVTDIDELALCDEDFDGEYTIYLAELNSQVMTTTSGFTFTVHATESDAWAETGALLDSDVNPVVSLPYTVYVRVENNTTECVNVASVTYVEGTETPVNTGIASLELCEEEDDMATFDLTENESAVSTETNAVFAYYADLTDAQNQENELTETAAYLASQTVYVRVQAPGMCSSIAEFDVVVNPKPEVGITGPSVANICVTDTIQLAPTSVLADHTYTWTNSSGTTLSGNTDGSLDVIGGDGDDTYTLTVLNDLTGCEDYAEYVLDVVDTPVISNLVVTESSITVNVVGQPPYEYSLDGITWQSESIFSDLSPGIYTVYVRSEDAQCPGISQSTLVLNITNVITPNGDGKNDYFAIPYLDAFTDENGDVIPSLFSVYDRYGKELHREESSVDKTTFTWDGTYSGRPLPTGDYWYILQLADGRKFTGHITLKNK